MGDIISHAGPAFGFDARRLAGIEPARTIRGRNWSKADVSFYDLDGARVAVKDYAPRSALVRHTIGRWLIRREAAAYRAAQGLAALPALLGRVGGFGLATEWVDATPLKNHVGERLDDALFDRLGEIIEGFHERGVALADLHHRDVLLAPDGTLFVVDLATAWLLGERPSPWRRYLFRRFAASDRVNLARMRARFTGGDPAAAVAAADPRAAAWHRRGRAVKQVLDRLRGKRRG